MYRPVPFPRRPFPLPALLAAIALAVLPAPRGFAQVTSQLVIDGLVGPVRLVSPPADPRLFVVEQAGRIRVFDHDGTPRGVFLATKRGSPMPRRSSIPT